MIDYSYITEYQLDTEYIYTNWLNQIVLSENRIVGDLSYIFCNDSYLLELNQKYLQHDTYTDIITFDYSEGEVLSGDIFISVERIKENAIKYNVLFEEELRRVMSHGILHLSGYEDKKDKDKIIMRTKEDEKMMLFHVEQ